MLEVEQRELTFMLVHNVLPTKDRLHRLNQADSNECSARDGVETIEHLFCQCQRVQIAWAWMRRKILNKNLADPRANDFELINLVNGLDNVSKDFIFLIANYIQYVWKLKICKKDYYVQVDSLKAELQNAIKLNQMSQNKVDIDLLQ